VGETARFLQGGVEKEGKQHLHREKVGKGDQGDRRRKTNGAHLKRSGRLSFNLRQPGV